MIAATKTLIKKRKPTGNEEKEKQSAARKSFHAFAEYVNPRFQFYKHCELLADVLERVVSGEIKRLIIQMPPRHGKSEMVSRILAAYYLARRPSHFVCLTSYSYGLAGTLSRASRDNFERAGFKVKAEAGAVSHWETLQGGGMFAAGVGTGITGKGFNLGLIDDPFKDAEEANSLVIRDKVWDWYQSTFSTRTEPDAAMIVLGTRWHEDDLIGRLLRSETHSTANENWHIVSLAALFEATTESFPKGCTVEPDFRTIEGEALCPERYSAKTLAHKRSQMGDYHFGSLYQQRPTAPSGVLFDISELEFVDFPPAMAEIVRAWDKASTQDGGDYTAGVRMSIDRKGVYYIEDVARGQWNTAKRDSLIKITAELDGRRCRIVGEQEPGSGGVDSAKNFIKILGGFIVKTERATGSKELRADPFSSQVNAGNVRIVRGPWNQAFIEEMRQFPRGRYDDQVDAASLAFSELSKPRAKFYSQ